MPAIKIPFLSRFRGLFRPSLKPYLVDHKYKVIPAFSLGGTTYWMYDSATEIPTGRFLAAMGVHLEMESNCDKAYLQKHCQAVENILNPQPGKPISLTTLAKLNINMKERLELLPLESFIYKFASIVFFDRSESPYAYDYSYAEVKIKKWKAAGGTLDFFSRTPLRELIPALNLPDKDILTYSTAREMVEKIHQDLLIATE